MSESEKKEILALREEYTEKKSDPLEQLRKTDKKAKRGANIFAYSFGIAGSLVLGLGMCLAMKVIADLMPLGIVIGVAGIAMVTANYFIYRAILRAGKKKYADRILKISDELLHE